MSSAFNGNAEYWEIFQHSLMGKSCLWHVHNGKSEMLPKVPLERLLNEKQNQGT